MSNEILDRILERAGLRLGEVDYQRLARNFALLNEQAPLLRLPEARYAEPAMIYTADKET